MSYLGIIRRAIDRSIESPKFGLRDINKVYHAFRYGNNYYEKGADFLNEDWDTLIILDACRYDLFCETNILDGELSHKISRGSHTSQFLYGNLKNKRLQDTVYTTATPQLSKYSDKINTRFTEVYEVWNSDLWNQKIGTVLPEKMTQSAIESHKNHPNKRHIIHYLQPHYPFINSELESKSKDRLVEADENYGVWRYIFTGDIEVNRDVIWDAYKSNLKITMESVEKLLEHISGRIIVTSDHGNMVGERSYPIPIREWGHPSRLYTKKLVKVPWLTIDQGDRRKITSEAQSARPKSDDSIVNDRLQELGYL